MIEQEAVHPQTEIKTENEKTAEEERRVAQEILENLYDVIGEDDWLVHNVPCDLNRVNQILKQGIFSQAFADRARKRCLEEQAKKQIPIITNSGQGERNISTFQKNAQNPKNGTLYDVFPIARYRLSIGMEVGIIFTPLPYDGAIGVMGSLGLYRKMGIGPEKLAKFRVAPRRIRMLAIDPLHHQFYDEQTVGYMQQIFNEYKPLAIKNNLPIIDRCYNLLYPMDISSQDLQQITIPGLRELAKTLGIEKLRAISIEEIKFAADALSA